MRIRRGRSRAAPDGDIEHAAGDDRHHAVSRGGRRGRARFAGAQAFLRDERKRGAPTESRARFDIQVSAGSRFAGTSGRGCAAERGGRTRHVVQSGGFGALGLHAGTCADSVRHPPDVCGFGGGENQGGDGTVGRVLARRERPCPAAILGGPPFGSREKAGLRRCAPLDYRRREPGSDVCR